VEEEQGSDRGQELDDQIIPPSDVSHLMPDDHGERIGVGSPQESARQGYHGADASDGKRNLSSLTRQERTFRRILNSRL
jgi:hypothetical protein